MANTIANAPMARLLPVLIYIQTHLEDDLSLDVMAVQANLSPYHFHRVFAETVGETVKQYTQRLRLDKAAYQLKVRPTAITDIALGLGYQSHETFTRAFRRQFRITPRAFRQQQGVHPGKNQIQSRQGDRHQTLNEFATEHQLSKTTIQTFNPLSVVFIRHLGAYQDVDVSSFDELIAWAQTRGLYNQTSSLMGVGHDDPQITSKDKVRFDACLTVAGPVQTNGVIGYQVLPGGPYATTTYIGPYGHTLEQAYWEIFQRLYDQQRYGIVGIPSIEIYRTTRINPGYALNHTEICIPVTQKGV